MRSTNEIICDDNGIELLVDYRYDKSPSQIEQGHGEHEVGLMTYTELKSVEIVIAGRGIDLLPFLKENEKEFIISKLTYE